MTLKFSDKNLEKKFGNIFDKQDVLMFKIIYLFVLLGSVLIFLFEIFGNDFSENSFNSLRCYMLLVAVILFLLYGFVVFSPTFNKNTSIYLLFLYLLFIVFRSIYEWFSDTLSKIMTGLILSSLINMLFGPIKISFLALLVNILTIVRYY